MSPTPQPAFRFAPSSNGYLHLGHAFSALLNHDLARACGGRFLLRIEDIDRARARPAFEAAIFEDLRWLGLVWETPVRRQSEHFDDYAATLEKLDALGLLYACDCARADIFRAAQGRTDWPKDPDGTPLYHGACRAKPRLPARDVLREGGTALRLDMEKAAALAGEGLAWREFGRGEVQARPRDWGDVVLARKDAPASYHLAVVVDDALQGVTDVVRGEDLFRATDVHRLLQRLLGLPAPAYRHHRLLLDETGEKLSKSRRSQRLRQAAATPREARAMLSRFEAAPFIGG